MSDIRAMIEQPIIDRILILFQQERYTYAIEEGVNGLKAFPSSIRLRFLLGQAHEKLDQSAEARAQYLECLELEPEFGPAHRQLAKMYFYDGEQTKAEEHIKIALTHSADEAATHATAAVIYSESNPFKSQKHLKTARQLDPEGEEIRAEEAYMNLTQLRLGALRKLIIRNMKDNPELPSAKGGMGFVEISYGRYEQAQPLLKQAYAATGEAEYLEGWIDARLAKYPPFKWLVRFHALAYSFPMGFQIFPLIFWLIFGGVALRSGFPEAFDRWIWFIHAGVATYLSSIYLLKYPFQFVFRRKHHSETPIWTFRQTLKATLAIVMLLYWAMLATQNNNFLWIALFLLIYVLMFTLVRDRKHPYTKTIYWVLYLSVWVSFGLTIYREMVDISLNKFVSMPLLAGWIAFAVLNEPIEKWEERLGAN